MISKFKLKINKHLYDFINNEVLPGTKINPDFYWDEFSKFIDKYSPINQYLLIKRNNLQNKINNWHKKNPTNKYSFLKYEKFLKDIGYLKKEGDDFNIETENIDNEISIISGPQLVVPITNSRYALNAVNARWGSLYDAIYGTDVLGDMPNNKTYDVSRGLEVIRYVNDYLDKFFPLENLRWDEVSNIKLENNKIIFASNSNKTSYFEFEKQIVGYNLDHKNLISELILQKNNIHIRIIINDNHIIGKNDPANISDVIMESAISTILDCEDSVATVDADDKIIAYRNFLGLMKGNLSSEFIKKGKIIKRLLNKDIKFTSLSGETKILKGRSLMLIRNVGHLMTTPAILDSDGNEIGEGLMDCIVTSLIAIHDLSKNKGMRNSLKGSMYIVKPKMHGPEEVSFTNDIFTHVEKILSLPLNTIKVGIMDEERRTSVNLKECIRAAKSRVAFINTGFLDRTGGEIHTSMLAGPFIKKGDMKSCKWIKAYEKRNVQIGLKCGLQGRAQIGKGMWAMPDLMSEMIKQKTNHPLAGANCAWVPSPTAATLHAMHYHQINVVNIQDEIIKNDEVESLSDLLILPLLEKKDLSELEIISEIENNVQGILGYVVRWIDQGIGCSKVLDINNIGLMEDRATCRISSQALANWFYHGIINEDQILRAFKKMSKIVDKQNNNDVNYKPMSDNYDGIAFKAALDLVLLGRYQPSGYTEPILHKRRIELKNI